MRRPLIALLLICGVIPIFPPSALAAESDNTSSEREIIGRASDRAVDLDAVTTEEVPVSGGTPADGGNANGPGSGVSVAAADPQAARDYIVNCILTPYFQSSHDKPVHPCEPTTAASAAAAPAPAPITLTSHDVATLIVDGSGITLQPPGATVLLHMPLIAYTNPATRTLTTSVGGTAVDVEVTPATYTWNWGDGTTFSTTDPGQPYPNQTVTHLYAATADNVTVTLTTTWTARFKPTGATDWQPVDGYVTTTQTAPPFNIRRLIPYLSDDAEEHQGH